MSDLKDRVTELAHLMEEFGLQEAKLKGEDWLVQFSRSAPSAVAVAPLAEVQEPSSTMRRERKPAAPTPPAAPQGIPVSSPMTGIFYSAPSPGSPPFVREGESVTAGQVIGLIEAMKVFNEITAPTSGTVSRVVAEGGQLVQPGEALLYIA